MTFAWYGTSQAPLRAASDGDYRQLADRSRRILFSGSRESNRYGRFTGYQLKIIQECITWRSLSPLPISTWMNRCDGTTSSRSSVSWQPSFSPSGDELKAPVPRYRSTHVEKKTAVVLPSGRERYSRLFKL
jgi:hypothetical protein